MVETVDSFDLLAGPLVHWNPWLLVVNGQLFPGRTRSQAFLLLWVASQVVMTAGSELQSLQSSDAAATLAAPALTTTANGTMATLISPSFFAAPFNVVSRLFAAFLSSVILL